MAWSTAAGVTGAADRAVMADAVVVAVNSASMRSSTLVFSSASIAVPGAAPLCPIIAKGDRYARRGMVVEAWGSAWWCVAAQQHAAHGMGSGMSRGMVVWAWGLLSD